MIEINQIYYFICIVKKAIYFLKTHFYEFSYILYISRYISSSAEKINRSMEGEVWEIFSFKPELTNLLVNKGFKNIQCPTFPTYLFRDRPKENLKSLFFPSSPNIYSHNGSEYKSNKCSVLIPLYIHKFLWS